MYRFMAGSREVQERTTSALGGTEPFQWNRYSYQVPMQIGTDASVNDKHKFFNATLQAIARGGGDYSTKVGALCARFPDIGGPTKTQVENGLHKLFNFREQKIDMSDPNVFLLSDAKLHGERGRLLIIDLPDISAAARQAGRFCNLLSTGPPRPG